MTVRAKMSAHCRRAGPARAVIPLALFSLAACSSGRVENVVKDPDTASRLHVAEVAEASGQTDIALSMYRVAAETDPGNVQAQSRYAGALTQAGQLPTAEQVLASAVKKRPEDPVLTVALGRLKLQAGNPGEAFALFGKVLARDPANVGALTGRGVALDLSGQPEEAQRSYRGAEAADPTNIAAANNLAISLLLTGRTAEARAILGSLAQRPDAPVRVLNNLGIAQAVAGDRTAALATLAGRIGTEDLDTLQTGFGLPRQTASAPHKASAKAGEPRVANASSAGGGRAQGDGGAIPPNRQSFDLATFTPTLVRSVPQARQRERAMPYTIPLTTNSEPVPDASSRHEGPRENHARN